MSERLLMQTITEGVRAYFAPVDRTYGTALTLAQVPLDFDLDSPPSPWIDLGGVRNFSRSATSNLQAIRTGPNGVTRVQYRTACDAKLKLEFTDWGKLQMALAAGSQHSNVLDSQSPAYAVLEGSTRSSVRVDNASAFQPGDMVAVDADYAGEVGYVGVGMSAAYVRNAADVNHNPDYTRSVTWNIGKVSEVLQDALRLEKPLMAGDPTATMRVQKVLGFVDREGASYLPEWSGLFVLPQRSGGCLCFFYPRLQPAAPASEEPMELDGDLKRILLKGEFVALPVRDAMDGEQVAAYRRFIPAAQAPAY